MDGARLVRGRHTTTVIINKREPDIKNEYGYESNNSNSYLPQTLMDDIVEVPDNQIIYAKIRKITNSKKTLNFAKIGSIFAPS